MEEKIDVYIENCGCDDTTSATIKMTKQELESFVRIVKELNKNSTYGCQPKISVYDSFEYEIIDYGC